MRTRTASAALALALGGCAPGATVTTTSDPAPRASAMPIPDRMALGEPASFSWTNVDGSRLGSAQLLGRVTVLAFITSYDVTSQGQIRFVSTLSRDHVPRLNVVAVVLEPKEHRPIVAAYASALDLKFPVALADDATIRGEGAFAGLHHVPSIAILDREGRERFRHLGAMPYSDLEAAVRRVEDDSGVPRPR